MNEFHLAALTTARGAVLSGILCVLLTPNAHAHGGGLNAEGCHNNRKTGEYHCHRGGGTSGPSAPSAQFMQANPPRANATKPAVRPSAGPTCYTGPRGGTYTITASGRKNYGGC
ncbi:YHYH domain-containing protein [Cupriavidus plantarum]|uniref:YHYH domain-containing protein n=1 Tax=Cupriavidus plantarum TaxID=942865 RepID=UPI001BAC5EA1|nr:YHYH domain-containing protein [Cupriavidus plantarum]